MNNRRQRITAGIAIFATSLIATIVRFGFPPDQGWRQFLLSIVLFLAIQLPIFFALIRTS
jgi:hypothetical protein